MRHSSLGKVLPVHSHILLNLWGTTRFSGTISHSRAPVRHIDSKRHFLGAISHSQSCNTLLNTFKAHLHNSHLCKNLKDTFAQVSAPPRQFCTLFSLVQKPQRHICTNLNTSKTLLHIILTCAKTSKTHLHNLCFVGATVYPMRLSKSNAHLNPNSGPWILIPHYFLN